MKVETQLKRKRTEPNVSKEKKPKISTSNVKTNPNVKSTPKIVAKSKDDTIALHKLNFKKFKIQGIQTMCFNKNKTVLAVSRFNGEIQFWNTQITPWSPFKVTISLLTQKTIPGRKETTVHSILWLEDRFYTSGLHGYITEWDLETLSPKVKRRKF
jgi:hypothetical protein